MKTLGLDLGTNSVGWALVDDSKLDRNGKPEINMGVYVFPDAGELEGGLFVSHRKKHGMTVRMRRNLRRKRERRDALVRKLTDNRMLPQDVTERTRFMCMNETDPYLLRQKGLDYELTLLEFGRALFHISRRRGYLSTALLKVKELESIRVAAEEHLASAEVELEEPNEDVVMTAEKKEESKLLKNMADTRRNIQLTESRTLGEFYAKNLANHTPVRGYGKTIKEGTKVVSRNPSRDPIGIRAERLLFESEFEILWNKQAEFHSVLTPGLKGELYRIIFGQRPLRSQSFLVGKCTFIPNRRRLAKATLLAQRSIILQYLNTLSIADATNGLVSKLSAEQIVALSNKLNQKGSISWQEAKDAISLPKHLRFSDEPLRSSRKGMSVRGRLRIKGNTTAESVRKAIGNDRWLALDVPMTNSKYDTPPTMQEDLVTRLITCREFKNIAEGLKRDFGFNNLELYMLATIEFPDGHLNHCAEVIRKIEPHLLAGNVYSVACELAGFREQNTSTEQVLEIVDMLPKLPNLNNPVVQRSVDSAIKVINAVLDKYGKPDRIHIEMPRDVSRTNHDREMTWKSQENNAKANAIARKQLEELGAITESTVDKQIKKIRLWEEAGRVCPYFPDVPVTLQQLLDHYDIDHIVPQSVCYDDSYANLTICPNIENQQVKRKQTPWQAYGITNRWKDIEAYVNGLKSMHSKKKERILSQEIDIEGFTNNALSDTRYISKLILTHVKQLGVEVNVSRGQLTALLRDQWGLKQCIPQLEEEQLKLAVWKQKTVKKDAKPRFDHRHHALDAIVTALTDSSSLRVLRRWFERKEDNLPNNKIQKEKPWGSIAKDITDLMDNCVVVHASTRGIGGPLHEQTALKPPSKEVVDRTIAALPENQRLRIDRCVVVGKQLVYFDDKGVPTKAYDLKSNHHAVVWESQYPNAKTGLYPREITVVTTIEASRRAQAGEPVIQKVRNGFKYLFSVCKNDIVLWTGENPGLKRVGAFSGGDYWEIQLQAITSAVKGKETLIRIRSVSDLDSLLGRVDRNSIGEIVSTEPENLA